MRDGNLDLWHSQDAYSGRILTHIKESLPRATETIQRNELKIGIDGLLQYTSQAAFSPVCERYRT